MSKHKTSEVKHSVFVAECHTEKLSAWSKTSVDLFKLATKMLLHLINKKEKQQQNLLSRSGCVIKPFT